LSKKFVLYLHTFSFCIMSLAKLSKVMAKAGRRCMSSVLNLMPPENTEEIEVLLQELHMPNSLLNDIYFRFLALRRQEQGLASRKLEIRCSTCLGLVKHKKEWVHKILKYLLELGGAQETVTWDGFLFSFLHFCRLSKLELCQFMFYAIAMEMKTWTVHFITSTQLEEFYAEYHNCPVKCFDSAYVDFGRLPLAKYRIFEYVDLAYRFPELINPCLHLQRELRRALPCMDFWRDYTNITATNKRITIDHFRRARVLSIEDAVAVAQGKKVHQLVAEREKFNYGQAVDVPQLPEHPHNRPGFIPLPLGPPKPPRQPREVQPDLPTWMQEHLQNNEHPLNGRYLGTAAQVYQERELPPPLPAEWQAVPVPDNPKSLYYWNRLTNEVSWTPPPMPKMTVAEAKDVIRETMGPYQLTSVPDGFTEGLFAKPNARDAASRHFDDERTKELTFVRRAREANHGRKRRVRKSALRIKLNQVIRFVKRTKFAATSHHH